ncbi:MAG: hypothetical protein ACD_49C00050G0022 [uncultured bacterium (gcode 4)]|uniref:Uncharacterized protein n=1 Tax=uncultured bacterium (gcode 4) TaxID=1234023 RepID=K2AX43_9BACT|nr:MAG: hypothetical protein ACD_49C00050G0022 [uncultured bacterium (gcode 4)]
MSFLSVIPVPLLVTLSETQCSRMGLFTYKYLFLKLEDWINRSFDYAQDDEVEDCSKWQREFEMTNRNTKIDMIDLNPKFSIFIDN